MALEELVLAPVLVPEAPLELELELAVPLGVPLVPLVDGGGSQAVGSALMSLGTEPETIYTGAWPAIWA